MSILDSDNSLLWSLLNSFYYFLASSYWNEFLDNSFNNLIYLNQIRFNCLYFYNISNCNQFFDYFLNLNNFNNLHNMRYNFLHYFFNNLNFSNMLDYRYNFLNKSLNLFNLISNRNFICWNLFYNCFLNDFLS